MFTVHPQYHIKYALKGDVYKRQTLLSCRLAKILSGVSLLLSPLPPVPFTPADTDEYQSIVQAAIQTAMAETIPTKQVKYTRQRLPHPVLAFMRRKR